MNKLMPAEIIERKIYLIRGQKVMLDQDLADLYGVKTKVLIQSVKRNFRRFPQDFMFQLNKEESKNLRSQFVTSSWGGRRYQPFVFTEQGVAMLSSVLGSERAIQVNIAIMRTFVRIKQFLFSHKELAERIDKLESQTKKNAVDIKLVFDAIRQLLVPVDKPKHKIGFLR